MSSTVSLPDTCGIAFKEWAGVCDAIASGRQSLILRKGGIAEGPQGFVPEHESFWLYPTHVHEAQQGLRIVPRASAPAENAPGDLEINTLVRVEQVNYVADRDQLEEIEGFHVWTGETVLKRFEYRKPGLWLLLIRAFHESPGPIVKVVPEHAGCRTWVPLDPPLRTDALTPVLDDAAHAGTIKRITTILRAGS